MMGHREPLISGDEWDYLTRKGRRIVSARSGQISRIKRAFNKRVRKTARLDAKQMVVT
jgi:hypothetical protein